MRRLLAALAMLAASAAQAHGGLSMDRDACKLNVGRYLMHFAGYQEDAQRSEFCEDIPHKGRTIVVLDFIDDALRDLPVEVKVIRRVSESTTEGPTMFSLPPKIYPRGSLTFSHDFKEDGDYVGLVWAGQDRSQVAVFPFSVGRDDTPRWFAAGGAALLVLGAGGFLLARQRLRRDVGRAAEGGVA